MSNRQISAVARLRALPRVFSVNEVAQRADTTQLAARQMVLRWRKQGLITAVGPHLGLFYNLVLDPHSPETEIGTALQRLYPSAVLIGASVLHEAGLVTQIPSTLHVALSSRVGRAAQVSGVSFFMRPPGWYTATAPGRGGRNGGLHRVFGIPALQPAWALVDSFYGEAGWHPDPDDLINVTPALVGRVLEVCETLGVPSAPLCEFYSFYVPAVSRLPEY